MKILTKLMLTGAVLSAVAFAETEPEASPLYMPGTIEDGATVFVNSNTVLNTTIDNYGVIDTELESGPYPQITGEGEIINHRKQTATEVVDETQKNALMEANPVDGVTRVLQVNETGAVVNPDLVSGDGSVMVQDQLDAWIGFSHYANTDLFLLSTEETGRKISIWSGAQSGDNVNCNFGDQNGESQSFSISLSGFITCNGDFSNYKNGHLLINTNASGTRVSLTAPGELNCPMTVGATCSISECDVYSEVNVVDGQTLNFGDNVVLKAGGVLRLGAAPNN